ncbi:primary replicative DNA helicase [Verrucomicrobium sp. GAS474]|uniref:replicative DNA helicase n=1 Tax=Verrucomicrobium sp. GAS474 TaxID=1882831 RepID=UPI00087A831B|nr:replicative DNA helicase [Verrucomicrobium sp. GAS474]SDT92113.1 primary replicative DNA helicase [Verrucomicrobium sp. GAS474]
MAQQFSKGGKGKPTPPPPLGASVNADDLATPLYSTEAEQAVLGAMLSHPDVVMYQVLEKNVIRNDFFVPSHQEIFEALKELHSRQHAIDITTVHQYLVDRKLDEIAGSPGSLVGMVSSLVSHLNVGTYIKLVKDKSLLRHLQQACINIVQEISDQPHAVEGILDRAETEVFKVTDLGLTQSTVPAKEELAKALDMIERFRARQGKMTGIPTGFTQLDQMTTGWQPGDMVVLAARPGVGKTALALSFARYAMKERYDEKRDAWVKPGYGVGFFSLEMTNAQLILRLMASVAGFDLKKIRTGDIDEFEMSGLRQMSEDMKQWPLYLDDSSHLTINQLRGKARRMKQRYDIDLLVIDYLQLLHSESAQAKENRQNEVAEISRGIKGLAKDLGIPIIVLAQLNRRAEEGKTEPALHNLRESGAIEQDADMVLMLHRQEQEEDAAPSATRNYSLIIAKQRSGPTGKLDVRFNPAYTRFEDPVRHESRSHASPQGGGDGNDEE